MGNTDHLAMVTRREISIGLTKGSSIQQMTKGVNDAMGAGRYAAERLVRTGEEIEREFGIPIINKRISVTPIAMICGASGGRSG